MTLTRIKQKAAGRRFLLIISLLTISIVFFARCFGRHGVQDVRGEGYAGSHTCTKCHQSIADVYAHSNHYKTSSPVDPDGLKRLIAPAKNQDRFCFGDSSYIHIVEKKHALFQSLFIRERESTIASFDIAFGSAEKAQTYGYWKDSQLFQMPLTYFTSQGGWANSPGFPASHARYNRVITSRCFECHASFIDKQFVQTGALSISENLDPKSIVYGIDCERCHGPALEHVRFQEKNPSVKTAKYITRVGTLTRQQQLDICGTCHSGNDQSPRRSLFAFAPGDTLSHFFFPEFASDNHEPDVHGKQLQLLKSSLCFQKSDMTCNSCHNTHEPEKNKVVTFISKCMDCHQNSAHAVNSLKESEQTKRDFNLVSLSCIDCHMPLQTSKTIYFNNGAESKNIPYFIRTHKIAIYK